MGTRDPGPETETSTDMEGFNGGRPSCVAQLSPLAGYLLQHSSTVNRRPVPHKACQPASSKIPDASRASMSKHSQISALFCGSRNLFWAREPRGSRIRPSQKTVVEYHGSIWKSQSVAVAEQATSPSREGT